ncbi:UNVERIFIED_CONTAM: hypothetical protein PYX00_004211 [Menopon gallinae]|uniref:C2H2-type domain-containing protein n=1 Tax=Menopon gallinae TaxID=328185 RepID=A0AAW2I4F5_9NEOP
MTMEMDSIRRPNLNECELKKIKVESAEFNVLSCDLKTEPKDLSIKKSNKCGVSDMWNSHPNENLNKKICIRQETNYGSKGLGEIKTEPEGNNCVVDSSMRIKLEVKSYDLKGVSVRSRTEVPYDLSKSSVAMCDFETRLDKIPKDVLGRYGIVMEECDGWTGSEPENEEDEEEEDDYDYADNDEDDGDRKLVINEEYKAENLSKVDIPRTKIENDSTKENASEFTNHLNAGHHLKISNVMSLQWHNVCHICGVFFPSAGAVASHKKGHCSFPGCLDYIENDVDMEKHLQGHRANPAKPFRCELCKKRFHYYRFSKRHRLLCKVLKRSKCPHCKYGSSKPSMFNRHVAKHLDNLTCTDCSKTYNLVKKFSKHLRDEHRKRVLFQCTECPKSFDLAENIVDHIELHSLSLSADGLTRFIRIQAIDPL